MGVFGGIGRTVASLAAASALAFALAADEALLERGSDHFFNIEYEEALRDYYAALKIRESSTAWNRIASALLFQELHRLGKLETSAFRGDNAFLDEEKPQPDPAAEERFLGALYQARRLAEAELERNPRDVQALFSLSSNYGLQANYEFMLRKSYYSALRNGSRARRYAEEILAIDPNFVDAYLVRGVQEYVVGSLPWAVKVLAALGGVRGSKQKGEEWVTRVAREGKYLDREAQTLLVLLYRRERRPLEAASILESLSERFPRNYVYRLERAAMFLDAGKPERALEVFREIRRMVRDDVHRHARMPERLRGALERKIEELESAAGTRRAE